MLLESYFTEYISIEIICAFLYKGKAIELLALS